MFERNRSTLKIVMNLSGDKGYELPPWDHFDHSFSAES